MMARLQLDFYLVWWWYVDCLLGMKQKCSPFRKKGMEGMEVGGTHSFSQDVHETIDKIFGCNCTFGSLVKSREVLHN